MLAIAGKNDGEVLQQPHAGDAGRESINGLACGLANVATRGAKLRQRHQQQILRRGGGFQCSGDGLGFGVGDSVHGDNSLR